MFLEASPHFQRSVERRANERHSDCECNKDAHRGALKTRVENLYHIGRYVFPGAGVKTLVLSANTCASMILEKYFQRS